MKKVVQAAKTQLRDNRMLQNTAWIIGERIVQMLISLVITAITARYLTPNDYGIITYTTNFVAMFTSICALGLDGIVVKDIVDDRTREGEIIGTAVVMRFAASLVSMAAIIGLLYLLNPQDSLLLFAGALQSVQLIFRSAEIIEFWYQSRLESKYASIIKIIGYLVMSAYKVWLLATQKTVIWFAMSSTIDIAVIAVLYLILFQKHSTHRMSFSMQTVKSLWERGKHFLISSLIVVLYTKMDTIMIQKMLPDGLTQVAYYSVAITVCNMWIFIPQAVTSSARPLIMQLKNKDEALYLKRLKQLYAALFSMGIVFGILFSCCSKLIIRILYSEKYMPAQMSLIIAIWYTGLAVLGTARGIWLICEGKNKYAKNLLIWGVVVNLLLNAVLIPRIGIEGAAIATFVTQFVTCFIAPLLYKDTRIHTKILLEAIALRGIR